MIFNSATGRLVGQYNQFLEKYPPLAAILEELNQSHESPRASPLSAPEKV